MACGKGGLREEGKNRNDGASAAAAAATSVAFGDALLFTTMYIIGMPVDVHAKDGSVYSGIFHTASVDEDYAIVLKKARMIKKGNLDANVVNGTLLETLIVQSEDLVQVVAKGVLLPSNGVTGYFGGDGVESAAGYNECLDRDAEVLKHNESNGKKKHKSQSRQVGDGSLEIQGDWPTDIESQDKKMSNEVQGSSLIITSSEAQSIAALHTLEDTMHQKAQGVSSYCSGELENEDQDRATSDENACSVAPLPKISVASTSAINVKSESCLNASSNPFLLAPPKSSSFKRTAKESKLNPGAKMFSPSMLHHKTATPPAVPNRASDSYMPGTYTMAPLATAQEEVDGSSFARSSVPIKFVPYNNVTFGHGGNDAPYIQPIVGHTVNRTQPVRYAAQYPNFQTGHSYVHPNPQNVIFGRVGPLVCMHPVSNDAVQTAVGFSSAATRPVLTPHQVHLPKHQGNASAQALQLCMTPPIIANGPQPFVIPNSIPISQSVFPMSRPIAVPGTNGFLSTKFV